MTIPWVCSGREEGQGGTQRSQASHQGEIKDSRGSLPGYTYKHLGSLARIPCVSVGGLN